MKRVVLAILILWLVVVLVAGIGLIVIVWTVDALDFILKAAIIAALFNLLLQQVRDQVKLIVAAV